MVVSKEQQLAPSHIKFYKSGHQGEQEKSPSAFGTFIEDYLVKPPFIVSMAYFNIVVIYLLLLAVISQGHITPWWLLVYPPMLYFIDQKRKDHREKIRLEVAHRIPYFADALANALSVGSTLEHSLEQASYYLEGEVKKEFDAMMIQVKFGKNIGALLRDLDAKFPNTGITYLISLLDAYGELGVGISPLLKRISNVLMEKEKAEEKIKTILSAGSSYAKMSVGVFGLIFLLLTFVLRDKITVLLSPMLKPYFMFLICWTFAGVLVITKISSLQFSRTRALLPYISDFLKYNKLTEEELMNYSGIEWTERLRSAYDVLPLIGAFLFCYVGSWYTGEFVFLLFFYVLGYYLTRKIILYLLRGLVEDQLIRTIEVFPDILQVFIIGLNSGLNSYLAFNFALKALKGYAPKILRQELTRTKFAMECGEDHSRTWQVLANRLPFESIVDFCEIMVVSPMAGESIVNSIIHMTDSYQDKKLKDVEKMANAVGQAVIPLIILIFFPMFLFVMFAPIIATSAGIF